MYKEFCLIKFCYDFELTPGISEETLTGAVNPLKIEGCDCFFLIWSTTSV